MTEIPQPPAADRTQPEPPAQPLAEPGKAGPVPLAPGWAPPGYPAAPAGPPRQAVGPARGRAVAVVVLVLGPVVFLAGAFLLLVIVWGLAGGDSSPPGPPLGFLGQVALSPGGAKVALIVPATASSPAHVQVADAASGRVITTVTGGGRDAAVAFSPDGTMLATCDATGQTYLWDIATRYPVATLTDRGQGSDAVAFSPDGTILAEADTNGHIYVWQTASRHKVATLTAPDDAEILALAFGPDGKTIRSSNASGSTHRWKIG